MKKLEYWFVKNIYVYLSVHTMVLPYLHVSYWSFDPYEPKLAIDLQPFVTSFTLAIWALCQLLAFDPCDLCDLWWAWLSGLPLCEDAITEDEALGGVRHPGVSRRGERVGHINTAGYVLPAHKPTIVYCFTFIFNKTN